MPGRDVAPWSRTPPSALLVLSPPWRLHEAQVLTGSPDERPSFNPPQPGLYHRPRARIHGRCRRLGGSAPNQHCDRRPAGLQPVGCSGPKTPTPAPTPTPPPSVPGSVDLDNASGHDVSILIHDQVGDLVDAESGKPGDGMSVRWHDSIVENVDAGSIRVTWVGLPGDDVADLGISGEAALRHHDRSARAVRQHRRDGRGSGPDPDVRRAGLGRRRLGRDPRSHGRLTARPSSQGPPGHCPQGGPRCPRNRPHLRSDAGLSRRLGHPWPGGPTND